MKHVLFECVEEINCICILSQQDLTSLDPTDDEIQNFFTGVDTELESVSQSLTETSADVKESNIDDESSAMDTMLGDICFTNKSSEDLWKRF